MTHELLLVDGDFLPGGADTTVGGEILIRDGVIAAIGAEARLRASDDARELNVAGRTVLPGFIDCHVHVMIDGINLMQSMSEPFSLPFYRSVGVLRRTLDLGITTVRDAGGADLGLKTAQARGLIEGPELVIAVNLLSQTGGHADGWMASGQSCHLLPEHPGRPHAVVDGPEAMRLRVRELMRAGADVIKVCASGGVASERDDPRHSQFDREELDMCVRTAASNHVSVMAHAHGREGILNALRSGVRSIEHGIFADQECFELLKSCDAWLVPTLTAPRELLRMIQEGASVPQSVIEKTEAVQVIHAEMAKAAVAAGVRIAFGTDAGVFTHGANLTEFRHLRDAGLAPIDVIRAATEEAAALLELDDRGEIAVGKRADLVVVDGDVFDFEGYKERIGGVIQRGKVVRWS